MLYYIEQEDLDRLRFVARRLYSEVRMNGDDMRDLAQMIDYACNHAWPEEVVTNVSKLSPDAQFEGTLANNEAAELEESSRIRAQRRKNG